MNVFIDIASAVCLIGGGAFVVIGSVGLMRMPDFFTRLHAASVCETLGAWLILLGLVLQAGWSMVSVKLIMIFLMLAITSPTATHALAKSALHGGVKPKHLEQK